MSALTQLAAEQMFDGHRLHGAVLLQIGPDGNLLGLEHKNAPPQSEPTTLTPTFFDIHTHGALGHDVMSAVPADLAAMQRFLATHGVGAYLPTTVTAEIDLTFAALERLANLIERGCQPGEAEPVGIHLEGPFLSHHKRGVHPPEHLQPPSIALFDGLQQAARGHIVLLTLAPELPGATDLIQHAANQGVRVSLGHTNATAAETLAALETGATSATHTFNAMRPLDHREPGVLGTVLDDDRLFAELICDGIHVAPPLVRLWLKAKGAERTILVTDAMAAAGGGDGLYHLGGLPVTVRDGRALLSEDLAAGRETLAGSVLTMDRAVRNFQQFTGVGLLTAIRAASTNPARLLGRLDLATVTPGQPANLNRFNASGRLLETYLRGVRIPAHS